MITLYTGMAGQAGRFAARRAELESLLRSVPGLAGFRLFETAEGVASVAVGRERAACEECGRRVSRWMDAHMPGLSVQVPLVVSGEVIAEVALPG